MLEVSSCLKVDGCETDELLVVEGLEEALELTDDTLRFVNLENRFISTTC